VSSVNTHRVRLENSDNVGAALRRVREQRGLSIEQLAHATKIAPLTIRAIEQNQIERVPRGIFLRGFLRAYAGHVGLDVEDTVAKYLAQFDELPEPVRSAPSVAPAAEGDDSFPLVMEDERRGALGRRIVVAAAIALCVWGYLTLRESQAPETVALPPAAAPQNSQLPATVGATPDETTGTFGAGISGSPAVSLRLDIIAIGPCWVEATSDGVAVFADLMQEGQQRSLDAREDLMLLVGDPATFTYRINGLPGRPLGRPAVPVAVRITPDNYSSFVEPLT
jgi:cytoskeletal protein RodZ